MMLVEISRKFLHIFSSIIPLSYLWFFREKSIVVILLGILSLISMLIELFRYKIGSVDVIFKKYFNFMLRENELKGSITGATWLIIGNLVTIYLYPIYIAVPALLFLSIGDSFAALFGKKIPKFKIGHKSIIGTLAGILSSLTVALIVNQILPTYVIVIGAVTAMLVELIPSPLNDNLTIPILSGLIMIIIL
jgi:glycerol-3-phosphate acyltransferase PlsY